MDRTKLVTDPKYMRTRDINDKLSRIEDAEKAISNLEERMSALEEKVDAFLSYEKEKYKRISDNLSK